MNAAFDVGVVGAGPAGLAAALHLRRQGLRVGVIDRALRARRLPEGEHLSGEGVRLLTQLVGAAVESCLVTPVFETLAWWGGEQPSSGSDLFDPYGQSYIVERGLLLEALRAAAEREGVHFVDDRVRAARLCGPGLTLSLSEGAPLRVRFGVDATGRSARLARTLGVARQRLASLVAVSGTFSGGSAASGRVWVESVPDGWWYVATLTEGRAVAILFTDPEHLRGCERETFYAHFERSPCIRAVLEGASLVSRLHVRDACSQALAVAAGPRFVAVGDAALAKDPLSASGLTQGLRDAAQAASVLRDAADGQLEGVLRYASHKRALLHAYRRARADYYAAETRYRQHAFWRCHTAAT